MTKQQFVLRARNAGLARGQEQVAEARNKYAPLLPRMKKWYHEGHSFQIIADRLNKEHRRTLAGLPFTPTAVCRIFQRNNVKARPFQNGRHRKAKK